MKVGHVYVGGIRDDNTDFFRTSFPDRNADIWVFLFSALTHPGVGYSNQMHNSLRIPVETYKKWEKKIFVGVGWARELIPIFFLSSHSSEESRASFSITWKHRRYPFHFKTSLAISFLWRGFKTRLHFRDFFLFCFHSSGSSRLNESECFPAITWSNKVSSPPYHPCVSIFLSSIRNSLRELRIPYSATSISQRGFSSLHVSYHCLCVLFLPGIFLDATHKPVRDVCRVVVSCHSFLLSCLLPLLLCQCRPTRLSLIHSFS